METPWSFNLFKGNMRSIVVSLWAGRECFKLRRWCNLTSDLPVSAVLEAGVPGDCPGHDPGHLLRSDPPTLPQQAVEAAALAHLLLGGRIRPHPHHPLDLHYRGLLFRARAGRVHSLNHFSLLWLFLEPSVFQPKSSCKLKTFDT